MSALGELRKAILACNEGMAKAPAADLALALRELLVFYVERRGLPTKHDLQRVQAEIGNLKKAFGDLEQRLKIWQANVERRPNLGRQLG